jgi:hypothetical protein
MCYENRTSVCAIDTLFSNLLPISAKLPIMLLLHDSVYLSPTGIGHVRQNHTP